VTSCLSTAFAQSQYEWRYYRPGNTGIQGDFNECIYIGLDGDPWIAGYNPVAEEGGIAKFIQADNRWFNVSNIDYAAFGSANDVGTSRVSDMISDGQGNLWMATWVGVLRMNLAAGPSSLVMYNQTNSPLLGGRTYDITLAPDGTIWVCGTGNGGAVRRDSVTGEWQRYRVTNTSQFDFFNNDLTIDHQTGDVYACANAASDIGGMVKFDGTRWTDFVTYLDYGLGGPWPFPGAPQSEAIHVRPSNGHVVVNPINSFTHDFDGTSWTSIPGGADQMDQYLEDSLGRLWGAGHTFGTWILQNGAFTMVDFFPKRLHRDPDRPGTIWMGTGFEVVRTDRTYSFSRSVADFPQINNIGQTFTGMAADHNGIAWVGSTAQWWDGMGGTLIRIDADTGTHQMWRHDLGWPFPGDQVTPLLTTPDGRVWMIYQEVVFPSTVAGLLAWDGTNVVTFPAPPNGAWQFGG
ncbi:MAG: hypothetical protein ACK528_15310, partial [Alphaproteobacteria bacterium]